jgi:hypothetical protein
LDSWSLVHTVNNNEYLNWGGGSSVAPSLKQMSFYASDTGGGTNDAGNEVLRLNATRVNLWTNTTIQGNLDVQAGAFYGLQTGITNASGQTIAQQITAATNGITGGSPTAGTNAFVSGSTVSLMPSLTNLTSIYASGSNNFGTATISNLYTPTSVTVTGGSSNYLGGVTVITNLTGTGNLTGYASGNATNTEAGITNALGFYLRTYFDTAGLATGSTNPIPTWISNSTNGTVAKATSAVNATNWFGTLGTNNVGGSPVNGYVPKAQANGTVAWAADSTGGSPSFDTVTAGTSLNQALVVGNGSSLAASGSGTITATAGWPTTWAISSITSPGVIVTNGTTVSITHSNNLIVDATHQFTGSGAGLTSIPMTGIVQPGLILTNGNSGAVTFSNTVTVDAGHQFSGSGAGLTSIPGSAITNPSTNGWAGATNALTLTSLATFSPYYYVSSTDVAITNTTGSATAASVYGTLWVSNSAASAITMRVTAGALKVVGAGSTNSLVIGVGKMGCFSVSGYGQLFTNYSTAVQQ